MATDNSSGNTLQILGLGMQGYGAYAGGQANADSLIFQASQSAQSAEEALYLGNEQARRVRQNGKKVLGDIAGQIAAGNIAREGSALDVLANSATNIEYDALQVKYQSKMRAQALKAQAAAQRKAAKNAETSGQIGLLSSVAQMGAIYYGSGG